MKIFSRSIFTTVTRDNTQIIMIYHDTIQIIEIFETQS